MYDSVDGIIRKAGMMKNNNIQRYALYTFLSWLQSESMCVTVLQ